MKITQDLHMHTHLSSCASPCATAHAYLAQAYRLGLDTLGITDHLWDNAIPLYRGGVPEPWEKFYGPQNFEHIRLAREEFSQAERHGLRVLFGAEVEYDPVRRDIAVSEAVAEQLDLILVPNSHTHMMMPKACYEPRQRHANFMLEAFWNILRSPLSRYVTAIAHPFDAVACPYDAASLYPLISKSQYQEAFCAATEKGIAIEINTSAFLKASPEEIAAHPKWEMIAIAKDCGCKFTFGSDCHSPEMQQSLESAESIAEILNLDEMHLLKL